MKKLVRFGVSLDQHLLVDFDRLIERRRYTNRSEAIRDLIRDSLVGQEWDENKETVATITFVYDHHVPDLARKLTHIQHDFQGHIMAGCMSISTMIIAWRSSWPEARGRPSARSPMPC